MTEFSADDYRYMAEALRLAARGQYSVHPNPLVGCVIVRDGMVLGRGFHRRAGEPHAEVYALAEAGERARGATAYVTLEPCAHHGRTPPCAEALIAAGVAEVVVAVRDANPQVAGRGLALLRESGIRVRDGVLVEQALAQNPGFLRVMAGGRPWLRAKIALSADGRSAMASGESQWITGAPARADVQRWRARSSAIVTGSGTVLADDPSLSVRPAMWTDAADLQAHALHGVRQPERVVLDSLARTPVDAALFASAGAVRVLHSAQASAARVQALAARGALMQSISLQADVMGKADVGSAAVGGLAIDAVLAALAEAGHHTLMLEAGAVLTGAFLRAGVVDELIVYQAPTLLGSAARAALAWPMQHMAEQCRLRVTDRRQIGEDTRTMYHCLPAGS
ncbi:MAG: bifunctional diaminohydroxyphosphoribosylaminopyrimidine deaminase/5-amino-6-(5-phosphoribosylamino)uracil reductase RibD [Paraperlucidibaca sp.]